MVKQESRKFRRKVARKVGKPATKAMKARAPNRSTAKVKHKTRTPNRLVTVARYSHGDPGLRTGEGGLTVWTLQKMAQEKQFDKLDDLFNNGLTMDTLPVGLAAGIGVPLREFSLVPTVLDFLTIQSTYFKVDSKQFAHDVLDYIVGRNWRGKVFFPSNNKSASEGRNRIRESLILPRSPIVPMARFDTMLLDSDPLAKNAASNVVVLN